jgi:hypothetical protein
MQTISVLKPKEMLVTGPYIFPWSDRICSIEPTIQCLVNKWPSQSKSYYNIFRVIFELSMQGKKFCQLKVKFLVVLGNHGSMYSVPKAAHFFSNPLECIWERVPWQVNFRRRFNPPPFRNIQKHLTYLALEISKKPEKKQKLYLQELIHCSPDIMETTLTPTLLHYIWNGPFFPIWL